VARLAKPWFWEERKPFFVTIRGIRHNLASDKTEADRRFHSLMAKASETSARGTDTPGLAAAQVFDKYLDWCAKHRRPRTYAWYKDHIRASSRF
jgi:hypothetical protein